MRQAFISYVRENEQDVIRLHERLEAAGISCWLDKKNIMPGEYWPTAVAEAIQSGAYFLACFSKESEDKTRSHMREEIYLAIEAGKLLPPTQTWIIPVRFSECSIPAYDLGGGRLLSQVQYVDLFADWEEGVRRILATMESAPKKPAHRTSNNTKWIPSSHLVAVLHDMNNYNTIVLGFLALALSKDQAITDPETARLVRLAKEAAERGSNLIR